MFKCKRLTSLTTSLLRRSARTMRPICGCFSFGSVVFSARFTECAGDWRHLHRLMLFTEQQRHHGSAREMCRVTRMFFKAESPKSSMASPEEELAEVPDESDSGLSIVKLSCMADCATRLVVAASMRKLVWGGVSESALGDSGRAKLPCLSCFPPACQCTTDHAKVEEASN